MLKSKSEFFEQQSKKPEGSYQPEALKKLQELQEKAWENRERIRKHKEYIEKFYNSLNKSVENQPLEESKKSGLIIQKMQAQYDSAIKKENEEFKKIEAEIEETKNYCRNTLNMKI